MSGNRAGLLFDLDGTLVDTNYLHALAWSRAFRSVGHWAPMNAIHRLLGMSGDQLVLELLARPCPAAAKAQEGYFAELIGEAAAFPGATALVREAHELGLRAVLASSAPTEDLEVYIDILDIASHVDAVTSADDVKESKPAPDVFRIAMDAGGLDRARSLAIGDTVWDVRAARSAGIGCIAVESGGFSRHELTESGALCVYTDVAELLRQIHTSPIALLGR